MKKRFFLLSVGCLLATTLFAQTPVIRWQKTIGGDAADEASAIVPTPDGGYIIGGKSNSMISGEKTEDSRCTDPRRCATDYWVLKLDDTGAIQWQRTLGCDPSDELTSIGLTTDGGYIVGGISASGACSDKTGTLRGNSDYWVLKLDAAGNVVWEKTYGGTGTDRLVQIEQTADGGYIAGGTSQSNASGEKTENSYAPPGPIGPGFNNDYWILKLDDTGKIEWQKTLGGFGSDELAAVHQTADGGYIAGGTSSSGITGLKTDTLRGNNDYWILKLNATGNITWQKTIGGNKHDVLASIRQTSDGGYILAGSSMSDVISGERTDVRLGIGEDYWVLKLSTMGDIEWQRAIRADMANKPCNIEETWDGGYIVGGTSTSDISGDKTEDSRNLTNDYWVLKIGASGNIQWQKTIGGNGADDLAAIRQVAPHEYILAGKSGSSVSGDKTDASRGGDYDYWIVKLHFDCDTAAQYAADSFCSNENFSYTLPGGDVVSAPGVYRDTLVTAAGCDSIWVTTLSLVQVETDVTQAGETLTASAAGAGYQWINCADQQPVSGATGKVFTPVSSGSYAVVVTASGCRDTSGCFTVIPSGLEQAVREENWEIYPNPANNAVYINTPNLARVEMQSMDGRIVLQGYSGRVDISWLAPGIYLVRIIDRDGRLMGQEKMIKAPRS